MNIQQQHQVNVSDIPERRLHYFNNNDNKETFQQWREVHRCI